MTFLEEVMRDNHEEIRQLLAQLDVVEEQRRRLTVDLVSVAKRQIGVLAETPGMAGDALMIEQLVAFLAAYE